MALGKKKHENPQFLFHLNYDFSWQFSFNTRAHRTPEQHDRYGGRRINSWDGEDDELTHTTDSSNYTHSSMSATRRDNKAIDSPRHNIQLSVM